MKIQISLAMILLTCAQAQAKGFYCDVGYASNNPSGTDAAYSVRFDSKDGQPAGGVLPAAAVTQFDKDGKPTGAINMPDQQITLDRRPEGDLHLKMVEVKSKDTVVDKLVHVSDGHAQLNFAPEKGVQGFFDCNAE